MASGVEARLDPLEVGLAVVAQVVDLAGRVGGRGLARLALAVEDAQRVLGDAVLVLVAELVPARLEVGLEGVRGRPGGTARPRAS